MTEFHPAVRSALNTLAPPFENTPADWEDALSRGTGRSKYGTPRRLIAIAVAVGAFVGLATSPFGQAVVRDTLDQLGAWVDGEPGNPASPEDQEAFRAANEASFASFPDDTRLRELTRVEGAGSRFTLFGFRDGNWFCLRLTRAPEGDRPHPAGCASIHTLAAIEGPVAIVSALEKYSVPGHEAHALYGFAVDGVTAVDVVTENGERLPAQLQSNAFVHVSDRAERVVSVIAVGRDGAESTVPVIAFHPLFEDRLERDEVPGPAEIEREVEPTGIAWLERREERGRPFNWPRDRGAIEVAFARSVKPDATSAFRMGLATGEGTVQASDGRWFCLQWQWPLVEETGYACIRAEFTRSHMIRISEYAGGDQLPIETGVVSDHVASMELFYANGEHQAVPLGDNVFAVQLRRIDLPGKIVAYDDAGRVIGIELLYGHATAAEAYKLRDVGG
jgi:hypothetical protein